MLSFTPMDRPGFLRLMLSPEGGETYQPSGGRWVNLAVFARRLGMWSAVASFAGSLLFLPGCSPKLPSAEELAAFNQAGPVKPQVDLDKVIRTRSPPARTRWCPEICWLSRCPPLPAR